MKYWVSSWSGRRNSHAQKDADASTTCSEPIYNSDLSDLLEGDDVRPTEEVVVVVEHYRKASLLGAWVNLANCAVGAGILSLPFAVKSMGIVLAVLVYLSLAVAAWYTLYLLVVCAEITGALSYEELVELVFGSWMARLFKVVVIVYTYGVCAGYILAGGDLFASVLREWIPDDKLVHSFFVSDTFLKLVVTLFVIAPLASLRRLDYLKWVSAAAIVAVLYFTAVVVVQSAQDIDDRRSQIANEIEYFKISDTVFKGIPVMAFALGGHLQSVSTYSELKDSHRTPLAWGFIAGVMVVFLSVLYMLVGILSYLRLMEDESGNILTAMVDDSPNDVLVQVAALAMGLVVTFSFPLFSWAMCNSFETLLFRGRPFSWCRHMCETAVIVLGTLGIALLVNDLSIVFGLVGSTGAVLLKFLLPSVVYLFIHRAKPEYKRSWFHAITSVCIVASGVVIGTLSTTVIVADWFGGF